MDTFLHIAAAIVCCYLLGSVNIAILVSRALGRDIRDCGSGNAGSTNMLRTFGWGVAIPVFIGDLFKGALAVMLGRFILSHGEVSALYGAYIGAVSAEIGHIYPVYFHFHGGKGVAISVGAIIALHPVGGPLLLLGGFGIAALTGYVSAGSVLCAAAYPFLAFFLGGVRELVPAVFMAAIVLYSHRENIKRLLEHRENKFIPPANK